MLKAEHAPECHVRFSSSSYLTVLIGYGSGTTTMKPPFGGQADDPSLPCLFLTGFQNALACTLKKPGTKNQNNLWLFCFSVIKSEKNEAAVDKMFRNITATLWSFTYILFSSLDHRSRTGRGGTWRRTKVNVFHLFLKWDICYRILESCGDLFHSWHTCITPLGTNGNDKRVGRGELPPKTAGVWTRL